MKITNTPISTYNATVLNANKLLNPAINAGNSIKYSIHNIDQITFSNELLQIQEILGIPNFAKIHNIQNQIINNSFGIINSNPTIREDYAQKLAAKIIAQKPNL